MNGRRGNETTSERTRQNFRKFVARQGDGVGLHAAGVGGLFHHFGRVRGREAVTSEQGNLQMGDEGTHPHHSIIGHGGFTAGEEAGDNVITIERFGSRLALAQGGEIHFHDVRQQRGANGSMGRGKNAADGSGQPVDGAQAGIGERESAEQTRERHVLAGAAVAAIIKGGAQRARGADDAFPAQRIGEGIGARADEGLDELGEGVQPGAGGEGRWQIAREFRVNERDARKHEGTAEADLEAVFGRGKDGVAGDFGAGARGGGDGDERGGGFGERPAAANDLEMVEQVAAVGEHGGDGLAGVERAAAAEGDDEIAMFARSQRDAVPDGLNLRLAGGREDDAVHALFTQQREQRPGAEGVASDDDERAPAESGGEWSGVAEDAGAENDAIGGGKFKPHGRRGYQEAEQSASAFAARAAAIFSWPTRRDCGIAGGSV